MGTIWLIRHGQASFGASDYDRLSETGVLQSMILGQFLFKSQVDYRKVFSGSMNRQMDTAKIAMAAAADWSEDTEPVIDERFNEYDFIPIIHSQLPDLLEDDPALAEDFQDIFSNNHRFQKIFGRIMKRWISGTNDKPGVESYREYSLRVSKGIENLAENGDSGKPIAVFTSGGVISIAMQVALGLSDHEAMRLGWYIRNASVSVFRYSKARFDLVSFNSTAHLELESDEGLLTFR